MVDALPLLPLALIMITLATETTRKEKKTEWSWWKCPYDFSSSTVYMFKLMIYFLDLMYDNLGDWFFRSVEHGLGRKKPIIFTWSRARVTDMVLSALFLLKSDTFQPCFAHRLECSGLCLFPNRMGILCLVSPVCNSEPEKFRSLRTYRVWSVPFATSSQKKSGL